MELTPYSVFILIIVYVLGIFIGRFARICKERKDIESEIKEVLDRR